MKQCLFRCGEALRPNLDCKCNACGAQYHFACAGPTKGIHQCKECLAPLHDTTIAYWATQSFEKLSPEERKGCMLDVCYMREGHELAFLPHKRGVDGEWETHYPSWVHLHANIENEELRVWAQENWDYIFKRLQSVDITEWI